MRSFVYATPISLHGAGILDRYPFTFSLYGEDFIHNTEGSLFMETRPHSECCIYCSAKGYGFVVRVECGGNAEERFQFLQVKIIGLYLAYV